MGLQELPPPYRRGPLLMRTKERIRAHEGVRRYPYKDAEGYLTIGVGRCLDKVPLSDDEIEVLFANDYFRAASSARLLPGFEELNEARQGVLIEMVFQMGLDGVRGFKKFIAAYQRGFWPQAKAEMLDSKWAIQTPKRARTLADIFLSGEYS